MKTWLSNEDLKKDGVLIKLNVCLIWLTHVDIETWMLKLNMKTIWHKIGVLFLVSVF